MSNKSSSPFDRIMFPQPCVPWIIALIVFPVLGYICGSFASQAALPDEELKLVEQHLNHLDYQLSREICIAGHR
jgi:hypothetical protein